MTVKEARKIVESFDENQNITEGINRYAISDSQK